MAGRRALSFTSLSQVMPDVDRLLQGHKTVGQWSLGQICHHLAMALTYQVDGFPGPAPPWLVRKLIAPRILRNVLKTGQMREGVKVPEVFLPKPGLEARPEAEALRAAVAKFQGHPGPYARHPFFEQMSREDCSRFHAIHCAHHLSF